MISLRNSIKFRRCMGISHCRALAFGSSSLCAEPAFSGYDHGGKNSSAVQCVLFDFDVLHSPPPPGDETTGGDITSKYAQKLDDQVSFVDQMRMSSGGNRDAQLNLHNGANSIFKFLSSRGLAVGLVLGPHAPEQEMRRLVQDSQIGFEAVVRTEKGLAPPAAAFEAAAAKLHCTPGAMLVVSDKEAVLMAAHDAHAHTCNLSRSSVVTVVSKTAIKRLAARDYSVGLLTDLQLIVEHLNGMHYHSG
jgi:beta-phosphoglucomutase-like phosphatase (HAD superfamily)